MPHPSRHVSPAALAVMLVAAALALAGCRFFEDNTRGIATIDGDGGGFRWLTKNDNDCGYFDPEWSADGELALVMRGCAEGVELLALRTNGRGTAWRLDDRTGMPASWSALSPDGTQLAQLAFFSDAERRQLTALYVFAPGDDAGEPVAEFIAARSAYYDLAWSPDGRYLVALSERTSGELDAFIFEPATGWEPRHVDTPDREFGPIAFARDSSKFAVALIEDSRTTVRIVDAATGALTDIAAPVQHLPISIAWSPDGDRVIVAANDGLAVLRVTDGTVEARTDAYRWARGVTWAADGRIAVAHQDRIDEIRPDGTRVRTLYDRGRGELWFPQWSPDGERILFRVEPPYRD